MTTRICACCGQSFEPRPQVPNQSYCPSEECQRKRRQRWQRDKMQNDPDYRENQKRAQRAWQSRNPDYWSERRNPHLDDRNTLRKQRDDVQTLAPAEMELRAGLYRIQPVRASPLAKMDAWIVQMTPVCLDCPCKMDACKERT